MDTLLLGFALKHKGFLLFSAFLATPLIEWLSEMLGIDHMPLPLLAVVTLLVTVDFGTGIVAARNTAKPLTSKTGLYSVWKLISYVLFIWAITQLKETTTIQNSAVLFGILEYVEISTLALAILWEMHSWGENLQVIFGKKPRLFYFLDLIASAFEYLLIKKVSASKSDKDKEVKNEQPINKP